ncbi:hypothetical protein HII31_08573 [Pseudocercospora fuligena]|uniref:Uncharacterized protein n=1 Tax=Pseudocercospora fuligena TaxID=685502 RepID=A0A8H6VH27_9PEZI|nr:hypothetical protein HII31_08573 [Pseudocercospora fuligena]
MYSKRGVIDQSQAATPALTCTQRATARSYFRCTQEEATLERHSVFGGYTACPVATFISHNAGTRGQSRTSRSLGPIRRLDQDGLLNQSCKMLVRCRRSLVKMVNESEQHEQKIEALENGLADAQIKSAEGLAKQHRDLVEQNKSQEAKIMALESTAAASDSLVREVEDLRRDLASKESTIMERETTIKQRDTTIKEYEEAAQYCDRLQLDISELTKESNVLTSRNESLVRENEALDERSKASLKTIETTKLQLASAKTAVSDLEQEKAEWADLKDRIETDVKAKERVISDHARLMSAKDTELLDLRQQNRVAAADLEEALREKNEEIAKLQHSISSFRGQANLSQQRFRELNILQASQKTLEDEMVRVKRERDNAMTNLRRNEATRTSQLQKQREEHETVLAELGRQIEDLASQLQNAVDEKQKLADHIDEVKKQHDRQMQLKDEDRITAIGTITADLRSQFDTTVKERLSKCDERWQKSENALTSAKNELQSTMDRAKEEKARLVGANVELYDKQRLAELGRDALAVVVQRNCQVLASKSQQIGKLIEEKYSFREQLEATRVEFRALQRDNALQASTTNATTIKLAALEIERDQSRQASEQKQAELTGLQTRFSEQSEALVALQKSLFNEQYSRKCDTNQLSQKLQEKDGEVQMLHKLLKKNEEDGRKVIQGLQTSTNQLANTLQTRDHAIASLQSQIQGGPSSTTPSPQAMQLQCLLKQRDVTISELESKLRSSSNVDAEKQIEEAKKQVQKSAAELNCAAARVLHLRSQLAAGEDELKHVKQQLADAQRQKSGSMDIKSELELQLSNASAECEHYQKRLIELTDYSEKLSKKHEDCEKELDRVSFDLKNVRAENSFLDRRLEEGDMAVSKLEEELRDEKKCTEDLKRLFIASKPVTVDASTQVTTSPTSKRSVQTVACQTEPLKPKIKTSLPPVTGVSQLPTPASPWTPQSSLSPLARRDSNMSMQSARPFNPPSGPKGWSIEERTAAERYRPARSDRRHQKFCQLGQDHDGPCNGSPDTRRGRTRRDGAVRRRSRSPCRGASEGHGSANDRRIHDVYRP